MPTLEFHGYDAHAAHASYLEIVEVVRTLAYADEIVFDLPRESGSRVLDMSGRSRPFVRVHSRSRERAEELVERIARFCDVEAASLTHFKQETAMDMTTQPQFLTETEIVRGIAPIRQFGLAIVLHQVFSSPLDDLLAQGSTLTAAEAASASALVPERVEAILIFLANEGYMRREGASFQPNAEYLRARRCKGWYTMFVGGYSPTLLGLEPCLRDRDLAAPRDLGLVGEGSCAISRHDAIPLARALMARSGRSHRRLLDLGCGNAAFLAELCLAFPDLHAIGIEPSEGGVAAAEALIAEQGLRERVEIVHSGALAYLDELHRQPSSARPDLTILSFVLHEVLGQDGREAVVRLLRELSNAGPELDIIIIEVDDASMDPRSMSQPLARNYYNLYYLLHQFTRQKLVAPSVWEGIFADAGLVVVARDHAPPEVDSTQFEVGYLLRCAPAGRSAER